jgi:hypothetical protein
MLEATAVDALIIDPIQFYAELTPMNLGIPYIHASVAIHGDYSGYTPLCIYGDPHQTTLKCWPDPASDCQGQRALRCSRSDRIFLGSSHENPATPSDRAGLTHTIELSVDWRLASVSTKE